MPSSNKKVKNATPVSYNDIDFKSTLEKVVYKTLVENGFKPIYEGFTCHLLDGRITTVPFYGKTPKKGFHKMPPHLNSITYTPDFVFYYNHMFIVIEAKGKPNDVYPYKRNLFRRWLEDNNKKSMFFEVKSKRDTLEAIKIIKQQ